MLRLSPKVFVQFFLVLSLLQSLSAQNDSINYHSRKIIAGTSSVALYSGTLSGLYFLWYKDYSSGKFHFFNDNNEWLGIDKVGHAASSFNIAKIQTDVFEWSGMSKNKSVVLGSAVSMGFMTAIEVLDGFSSGWGFSWGDMAADIAGTLFFASQKLMIDKIPVNMKFSSYPSKYAKYNHKLLGENFIQQRLKDYNSQTYWISFNIASCLNENSRFPKWLNVAVGYGADGMIGAETNPTIVDANNIPDFERISQFYISPDIDFSKIKIKNPYFAFIVKTFNFIKVPAPTIECSGKGKIKFHYLFF